MERIRCVTPIMYIQLMVYNLLMLCDVANYRHFFFIKCKFDHVDGQLTTNRDIIAKVISLGFSRATGQHISISTYQYIKHSGIKS